VYGMAGSAYILMIPTVTFSNYFRAHIAGDSPLADAIWAAMVAIALVLAGVLGPFLGAYADQARARRKLLLISTCLAAVATALLSLVTKGQIMLGAVVFIGAHLCFLIAKAIYDSYLPLLGEKSELPVISSAGWGLGYIGSLACFALSLPVLRGAWGGDEPWALQMTILITAIFLAALALPALLFFPPDERRHADAGPGRKGPIAQVAGTLSKWRDHREAFKFLAAYYLINDAVVTWLLFVGIFMRVVFGLSVEQILYLSLLFYGIAIPATAAFGWLGKAWSERNAIYVTLAIWLALLAVMAMSAGARTPWLIAVLAGLVVGSTQALCRSLYARMIPPDRTSEFFGFNVFVGRASAALGPLVYGLVAAATQD
ncbi:MAG: MFS transporter, partial [Solimonas sp.]